MKLTEYTQWFKYNVECAFPMIVDSVLPDTEFGSNDQQEDAPHFTNSVSTILTKDSLLMQQRPLWPGI